MNTERKIPKINKIALFAGQNQIGLLSFLFIISTIFYWTIVNNADLAFWKFNNAEETVGEVLSSDGDLEFNEEMIVKTTYQFAFDGKIYKGISYSDEDYLPTGGEIAVLFDKTNPNTSKIKGLRTDLFSYGTLWLIVLLPLFIFYAFIMTRKDTIKLIYYLEKRVKGDIKDTVKEALPIEAQLDANGKIKKVSISYLILKYKIPILIFIANIVCFILF